MWVVTQGKRTPGRGSGKRPTDRSWRVQVALTAVIALFAVGVVGTIIVKAKKALPPSTDIRAVRVFTPNPAALIRSEGGSDPKVVLSVIEDPICPACALIEQQYGPTIDQLIDSGAVAVDYYVVAALDIPKIGRTYSSRAAAAAYCVADQSIDTFRKFHKTLFDPGKQPSETDPNTWPDDTALIETAKGVGANDATVVCIESKKYANMVKQLAPALKISGTPTIRINGNEWLIGRNTTPHDLVKTVTDITGPVPG